MQQESENLRDELQVALLAAEDIKVLRAKVSTLVLRAREEKEEKLIIQNKHALVSGKLDMVVSHMEKLMSHLRIESKQKAKIIESRKSVRSQLFQMRAIADRQQKIISSKNRYVTDCEALCYAVMCEGGNLTSWRASPPTLSGCTQVYQRDLRGCKASGGPAPSYGR